MVLLCYDPETKPVDSIASSISGWVEEVTGCCPNAPIILVGINCHRGDEDEVETGLSASVSVSGSGSTITGSTISNLSKNPGLELELQTAVEQSAGDGNFVAHLVFDVVSGENVDYVFEMVRSLTPTTSLLWWCCFARK